VEQVYEYAMAFDGKKVFVDHVDDVLKKAQARAVVASAKANAKGKKAAAKKTARKR